MTTICAAARASADKHSSVLQSVTSYTTAGASAVAERTATAGVSGSTVTWLFTDGDGFLNKPASTSTGLTAVGARTYDGTISAFLTVDPIAAPDNPVQNNGYVYAGNNPVTFTDPSGECFRSPTGGLFCAGNAGVTHATVAAWTANRQAQAAAVRGDGFHPISHGRRGRVIGTRAAGFTTTHRTYTRSTFTRRTYERPHATTARNNSSGDFWRNAATVGIIVGLAAFTLTGVGVFVDIGAAGGLAATALGIAGTTLDAVGCVHGERIGCAAAMLNGIAAATGGIGLLAEGFRWLGDTEGVAMGFGRAGCAPGAVGTGLDTYGYFDDRKRR